MVRNIYIQKNFDAILEISWILNKPLNGVNTLNGIFKSTFFYFFLCFVLCCAPFSWDFAGAAEKEDLLLEGEEDGELLDEEEELLTEESEETKAPKAVDTPEIIEGGDDLKEEEEEEEVTSVKDDEVIEEGDSKEEVEATGSDDIQTVDSGFSSGDAYENELYETYVQYYSKQVSSEDWNSVVGEKDEYTIQPNDTLWDVSKVLFGDSHYWPKLWSTNPDITNPHLIQPSNILGFIHGTEGIAPSLSVIQGGSLSEPAVKSSKPPPLPDFLKDKKIKIVGSQKTLPVLQNIPSSLPHLTLPKNQEDNISDLEVGFRRIEVLSYSSLQHYVSDQPVLGQGTVSDKKDYGSWFHEGQRVILEMRDSVDPGQKLVIIDNKGKIHSSTFGVRGPFGYRVQIQGQVKVIGRVPDSFDLYEAEVTRSFNIISIGSTVLNKSLIQFDHQPTNISGNAEAQIIGVSSLDGEEKHLASPYSVVYLNRGGGAGFSVGQMYQVKVNNNIDRPSDYGYDIKIGEVKIIHVEDRFATGFITQMSNPIRVGDYITPLAIGLIKEGGYDPLEDEDSVKDPDPPEISTPEEGGDDSWDDEFEDDEF